MHSGTFLVSFSMAAGLKMAVAFAGNSTAIQEMFKRLLRLLRSKTGPVDHRVGKYVAYRCLQPRLIP